MKRSWLFSRISNVLLGGLTGVLLLASSFSAGADGLTVGLLLDTEGAFDGYTLFTPIHEGNTYLIDNAGRAVHSWDIGTGNTLTPYLLEDGSVIRMNLGITQHAWDGSLVWDFDYYGPGYQGHHDIEVLPNGNVLLVAQERKTAAEAIAEGRDPSAINTGVLISEKIVEVHRTGPTSGEIVWEWHVWDHLIQDFDPTKANFGVVGDHPELIDINFGETNFNNNDDSDWLHANAVDYNPELDQIMVSVRHYSELWIIDHSTTMEEAATGSGGTSGMGGDILYRWGNPQAYRAGGGEDQQLFVQHDAQWIASGLPGEGNLLIFNNGVGRPEGSESSIEEIVPPVDSSGSYPLTPGEAFGPAERVWSYSNGREFFSYIMSGVGRLPNGNTLITSSMPGIIFEVTPDGETVWKYVNPMDAAGPLTQGDPVQTGGSVGSNQVFRAIRYAPDYPGLAGRDLTPGGVLELPKPTPTATNTPTVTDTPIATATLTSTPTPVIEPGDVNGDGDVSAIDAALILQLDGGLLDSLPYPPALTSTSMVTSTPSTLPSSSSSRQG